jgi:hypothetical protein
MGLAKIDCLNQRMSRPRSRGHLNWWLYLAFGSLAAAQQTPPQSDQLAVLEGHVVHAITKEPVRKARVILTSSGQELDSELVATTDEAGRFRFVDIPAARYLLTAKKSGFLDGAYRSLKPEDQGSLLKVAGGDRIEDLTLRLSPAGAISGRVFDADGDPVSGVSVDLTKKQGSDETSGSDDDITNQAGEYRFEGLSPGTYYVSANPEADDSRIRRIPVESSGRISRLHDLKTFYPAALTIEEAQGVRIAGGQEQPGIDVRVQRGLTFSVKGRIAGAAASSSLTKYFLTASVDGRGDGIPGKVLPNGDFVITGVLPGENSLKLMTLGSDGMQLVGRTEVTLTDQDVTGVIIAPMALAQVRVRVVLEGEEDKPVTSGTVMLFEWHENGAEVRNARAQYRAVNGTYNIDGVVPGKYHVSFNEPGGCYLKSVASGGRVLDPGPIDVAEGAVLYLLATYSKNVAAVTGDVEVPQDQPEKSIHVVLISEDPAVLPQQKRKRPMLDQSYHFAIPNLSPGKYLALAAEDDDSDLWDSTDFVKLLQSQGAEIELHEKDNVNIHLKLITKDETDALRQKLGL